MKFFKNCFLKHCTEKKIINDEKEKDAPAQCGPTKGCLCSYLTTIILLCSFRHENVGTITEMSVEESKCSVINKGKHLLKIK